MKKLLMLACLIVALAPHSASAREDRDGDDGYHGSMKANEMAGIGIGTAAVVGVAGYLLLRRRRTA